MKLQNLLVITISDLSSTPTEGARDPPFTLAFSQLVLTTTCLPEIADGGEFAMERSEGIPPVVQILDGFSRFRLPFESRVNISHEMIADIVTHL